MLGLFCLPFIIYLSVVNVADIKLLSTSFHINIENSYMPIVSRVHIIVAAQADLSDAGVLSHSPHLIEILVYFP